MYRSLALLPCKVIEKPENDDEYRIGHHFLSVNFISPAEFGNISA